MWVAGVGRGRSLVEAFDAQGQFRLLGLMHSSSPTAQADPARAWISRDGKGQQSRHCPCGAGGCGEVLAELFARGAGGCVTAAVAVHPLPPLAAELLPKQGDFVLKLH